MNRFTCKVCGYTVEGTNQKGITYLGDSHERIWKHYRNTLMVEDLDKL